MTERQSEAIATLCLMAAFADGNKSDAERERMKEIFESLEGPDHTTVYQRVLLGRATLAGEAAALDSPELRSLAYEMAAGVCASDGRTTEPERKFLAELARELGVAAGEAEQTRTHADALAETPLDKPLAAMIPADAALAATPDAPGAPAAGTAREKEVDDMILKAAMLCGGLELLPQSMATLGIVPLQTKLVHDVGLRYGYSLDRGHIGEFVATVGAGMASQVVEGYARKFLGKLAKKQLGGLVGSLTGAATSAAISFATTYAIGQVAKQYYGGGRKLAAIDLQWLYQEQMARGRELYARHSGGTSGPRAASGSSQFLDLDQLIGMLRR